MSIMLREDLKPLTIHGDGKQPHPWPLCRIDRPSKPGVYVVTNYPVTCGKCMRAAAQIQSRMVNGVSM